METEKILESLKKVESLMGELFLSHAKSDSMNYIQIQRKINKELFSIWLEIITSTVVMEEKS